MTLAQPGQGQRTIIVVDDDHGNATILELLLSMGTNYVILTYHDALEMLEHMDEIKRSRPILFFIDYLLPKMNGMVLCDRLHKIGAFQNVPIVLVSGMMEESLAKEARLKGITLIHKPYDADALLDVIKQKVTEAVAGETEAEVPSGLQGENDHQPPMNVTTLE